MAELLAFAARGEFRAWLEENCRTSPGVWLLLGKPGASRISSTQCCPSGDSSLFRQHRY